MWPCEKRQEDIPHVFIHQFFLFFTKHIHIYQAITYQDHKKVVVEVEVFHLL